MKKSPPVGGRVLAAIATALALVAGTVTPARADGATPRAAHEAGVERRTAEATVPADRLRRRFGQLKVLSPAGASTSLAQAPGCPDNWSKISVFVEWFYDTATRVTFASSADWGGRVSCTGMAYMSNTSNLYFRGSRVQPGTFQSCGSPGGSAGTCGNVVTSGDWGCGGVGACNGEYFAVLGLSIDLPPGWLWQEPAPAGCSVGVDERSMLCVIETGRVTVPSVN